MMWVAGLVVGLVLFGSILAIAESSISRMTRFRAGALRQEGRRNGALLEEIERDPAPYLNSIYLAVMFVQNGSAILVALVAEHYFADVGITLASVAFTLEPITLLLSPETACALANMSFAGGLTEAPRLQARAIVPCRGVPPAVLKPSTATRAHSSPSRTSGRWPRSGTRRAASKRPRGK